MSTNKIQHKVNHVALVVDSSGSMHQHQSQLIRVVDEFVAGLKAESDSLGHETRISLYSFDHRVENLVWDMDVKHLPSMRGLYKVNNGATALIEASLKSLEDLGHIWEEYGEHSFLQIVVTDGEENASGGDRRHDGDMTVLGPWLDKIAAKMGALPEHWTSAILVPNSLAKRTAQNYGFPAGNIAIWDADSKEGVEEAIGTVRAAATSFLRGREKGVRGTKSLFAVGRGPVRRPSPREPRTGPGRQVPPAGGRRGGRDPPLRRRAAGCHLRARRLLLPVGHPGPDPARQGSHRGREGHRPRLHGRRGAQPPVRRGHPGHRLREGGPQPRPGGLRPEPLGQQEAQAEDPPAHHALTPPPSRWWDAFFSEVVLVPGLRGA
ncbi:hypothetical protein GCM10020254_64670 [Streptomyces goshikiensis]